ncbi:MAG: hypothetical protein ACLFT0_15560, partial [Spirulinaceae cyanobacterium]
ADVFSKVIYGVLLTSVAQTLSAYEGYTPAIEAQEVSSTRVREYAETHFNQREIEEESRI